jgi:hypothetical protein
MKIISPILAQSWGPGGLTIAGHTINTRTLAGWALGIVIIALAVNCIGTIQAAKKEHESGERNEKVKFAVIALLAGLFIVGLLDAIGLISFYDISNGFSSM